MTKYELIKLHARFFRVLDVAGIAPADAKHIDMLEVYCVMVAAGEKVTYAIAVLAEKYGLSERTLYRMIKRMGESVRV